MTALYELAVLGDPTPIQIQELEQEITAIVALFGLRIGHEVSLSVLPTAFAPDPQAASAAVFYGTSTVPDLQVKVASDLLVGAIPVLPVVSGPNTVATTIPASLRAFNCLDFLAGGTPRIATALLECIGLLPRRRRVFLSYRRNEAREAALQLFDELSSRHFEVFLDTHGIAPAEDFQTMLWHRLCDSDVLIMLDTATYFSSRWTSAEYGRAQAKGVHVLRIGWPSVTSSPRTATATAIDIAVSELDASTGRLSDDAIARICQKLEFVRSQSHAVRNLNLVSNVRNAVQTIGGSVSGVGVHKAIYVTLADGTQVVVYPTVGVPSSSTLHEASINTPIGCIAVVYDHIGLHPEWLDHLDWLGEQINCVRWVKAAETAWRFADWEA